MAKDPPPPLHPWWYLAIWDAWTWISWPWQARQLKRAGFRHAGWMTWELGPDDPGQVRTEADSG